ncbi:LysM domain/BON superfamily protein [Limihaloglobus sulfuriphilus]|uniref:LysM domain/BON superfamily protein n=1 Tax=Limihaloglobus sulfuriphilus TaxID=1851148 RepID=A0A1Q2MC79_9BACT|nr:LysM peptidoglycan-binding domain-containing protein [Limihaloglobus sulfuriphilus]AQQ69877.1 LysM domain/BON superfamily protein [Limihaloglobus sulfuriphilus]
MSKAFKTGFLIAFIVLAAVFILVSINSEDEQSPSAGENTATAPPDEIPGVVLDERGSEPVRTAAIQTDALSKVRPQQKPESRPVAEPAETQTPPENEPAAEAEKPKPATISEIAASLGRVESSGLKEQPEEMPEPVEQTEVAAKPAEKQDDPEQKAEKTVKTTLPAKGQVIHVVESGENLSSISRAYYGTPNRWQEIQKANNIKDPSKLQIGQKLLIP